MIKKVFALAAFSFVTIQLHAQTIFRSEIVGRPTDSSITVNMFFTDSAEMSVQYGTLSGVYPNQTTWQTFADSVPAEIVINGLMPNTKYYYQILYRQPGTSAYNTRPEHTFHTHRPAGYAFVYTVEADPHLDANSDSALYRLCLQNQLDDQPDFMIDLGDFLMSDKLKNQQNQYTRDTIAYRCNLFRSFYETACHSVPLFIANGNHEGESGWNLDGTANNIAVWSSKERKKYFLNPSPDNFYTGDTSNQQYIGQRESFFEWKWGDAQFFVLDPFWYTMQKPDSTHGWRWTLGQEQYEWLRTNLQNSTSKFKFIFSHHLIGGDPQGRGGTEYADFYEWGGANLDTTPGWAANRPGWYKPIKDLLTENRATIFFHGHDHFFDAQIKDCMIYQETPQPSLSNFSYPNQAAQYNYLSGWIVGNAGHIRLTVDSAGTTVEYVRVYLPADTDATHHNKDVSAMYFIGNVNCYDSTTTGSPIIWNSNYAHDISYPNPFSRETQIEFTLTESEKLTLDVYDSQGKFVRRLIAGSKISSGKFTVVWDGRDGYENELPNGIYYYSLLGEKTKASGKMILTK